MIVPLQQGGRRAGHFNGLGVKLPHGIEHRVIVRIQNVFFELGMTGNMDLADPMMRNVVQIIVRIKTVVLRRNVDVIDIEQNPASAAPGDLG